MYMDIYFMKNKRSFFIKAAVSKSMDREMSVSGLVAMGKTFIDLLNFGTVTAI